MKKNLSTALATVLITTLILLGGCTTYVDAVKKDESYTKRVTEIAILWSSPQPLPIQITRSHGQSVTDKDRDRARKNIGELQSLFSRDMENMVSSALTKRGVVVRPITSGSATRLVVVPVSAEIECAPLGCKDSLWLRADLYDMDEKRQVWSGRFKVGAPFPASIDASVVQSFSDSLVSQLGSSLLL